MTTRTDVIVNFAPSPRIAEIAAPSVEIIMQDVVDTLRVLEDDFIGMSSEKLLDASGKQDLGGGVLVGITVALQDALLAFEGRTAPAETGTVTTGSGTAAGKPLRYTFVDTAADFVTANVQRGSLVINYTDNSIAEVYRVVSATELETKVLVNGIGNTYDVADVYHVHNITQVRATGGNLTAVDSNGDPLASGVLPTAFTQVLVTASSSATLQELTEIRYSVYQDRVWYQAGSGNSGTDYPNGTPIQPLDNWADVTAVAAALGFRRVHVIGDALLTTGDDITGLIIEGDDPDLTTITIDSAAVVTNCQFKEVSVTGTLDGGSVIRNCTIIPPLNFVEGTVRECLIEAGTISLNGSADVNFLDCWSGVAGISTPTIDYNGSGRDLIIRNLSGGIEIINKTGADSVSVDLVSGQLKLAASVTAGTFRVAGTGILTDASTGTTVNSDGLLSNTSIAAAVWNALVASYQAAGSFGEFVQKKLLTVVKFLGLK